MAKKVTFGKAKKSKSSATSFDFGMNVMSKTAKRSYRQQARKAGHKVGGGS
jgi:hypothetical protein